MPESAAVLYLLLNYYFSYKCILGVVCSVFGIFRNRNAFQYKAKVFLYTLNNEPNVGSCSKNKCAEQVHDVSFTVKGVAGFKLLVNAY